MLSQECHTELSDEQLATLIPQQPTLLLGVQLRWQIVTGGYRECPTVDVLLALLISSLRTTTPGIESDTKFASNEALLDRWSTTLNYNHGLKLHTLDLFSARTPYRLARILNAQINLYPLS